jgi:hypothetical protein
MLRGCNGKMMLKWILNRICRCGLDFCGSACACFCEHHKKFIPAVPERQEISRSCKGIFVSQGGFRCRRITTTEISVRLNVNGVSTHTSNLVCKRVSN